MRKKILFILISFFTLLDEAFAQDGIFWGHKITFEFTEMKLNSMDSLSSIEFYVNEYGVNKNCVKNVFKDSSVHTYILNYGCQGIGGGSSCKIIKCPDIYIKFNFQNKDCNHEISSGFKLIPVLFEAGKGPFQEIHIRQINLMPLMEDGNLIVVESNGDSRIINEADLIEKLIMHPLVKFEELGHL